MRFSQTFFHGPSPRSSLAVTGYAYPPGAWLSTAGSPTMPPQAKRETPPEDLILPAARVSFWGKTRSLRVARAVSRGSLRAPVVRGGGITRTTHEIGSETVGLTPLREKSALQALETCGAR